MPSKVGWLSIGSEMVVEPGKELGVPCCEGQDITRVPDPDDWGKGLFPRWGMLKEESQGDNREVEVPLRWPEFSC
ncbi:hypothetical protein ACH5RR_008569 [Cinchona calisaya]|uniref:Uncharacterized protein n=1 Tax=Cinchona calisaya TaxID=153742 RepID=A0ABD3AFK1_9GENT